jgi:hypothetical protein
MNPSARRIDQILTDTPLAATLLARLAAGRQAARLIAPICAEVAPDFDPLRPGTCDLRGGVLRIWLRSSAHSTKLRQAIPRLLAALQSNSLEVSEIRVGVQLARLREKGPDKARIGATDALSAHPKKLDERKSVIEMRGFSRQLALTLPDSELRRAIARFGRSIDAKLARMRESDQTFEEQDREKNDTGAQSREKDPARPGEVTSLAADKKRGNASHDRDAKDEK